jgi:hypothetical protein
MPSDPYGSRERTTSHQPIFESQPERPTVSHGRTGQLFSKLLLLPDAFFFSLFFSHSGHKQRSAYDSNRCIKHLDLRRVQRSNRQIAQNRDQPDRKQVGRDHVVPAGRMCVSSSPLPAMQFFNAQNGQKVASTSLSCYRRRYLQGATWLARDLRPLPSRDPGGAEFYPSCTQSSSTVSKRGRSAKPSSSRAHTTTTTW